MLIVICALFICVSLTACRHEVSQEKRIDVVTDIAEVVNDHYTYLGGETPLMISMTDIKDLADENSNLKKAIDKYDDVQDYKVYLIGKNRVEDSNLYYFSVGM